MRKLAMCFGSLAEIATLNTTLRSKANVGNEADLRTAPVNGTRG
jgi:hypothetical protein